MDFDDRFFEDGAGTTQHDSGKQRHGGRIRELILRVQDVSTATAFWRQALGQEPDLGQDGLWAAFTLAPGVVLLIEQGDLTPSGPLQLGMSPLGSEAEFVQHIVALGARVVTPVQEPGGSTLVVTPDGLQLVIYRR